jgi:serine/threonine-protein kinase
MADEAEARLGTRLGNYALKEIIGRGGIGVVYRASHIYIRKPFAVKVLHRHLFEQPGAKARFLAEAQTACLVEHPNIVGVTDFGEVPDGTVYLVMAEAPGVGLDMVLEQEGTLPLFRAIGVMGQVAQALSAVHARGIVHRDVKPENIMLARRSGRRELVRQVRQAWDGGGYSETVEPEECFDLVTLLDFGAARMLQPSSQVLGEQARLFCTPAYAAPETAQNGYADARSDIYSVAVVFYEMLTGQLPFDGDTPAEIFAKQISAQPKPPSQRNPYVEISPEAERVILRALEKDAERRQATMDELWKDLQRCYGSMRWRRPVAPLDGDLDFNTLRASPQAAHDEGPRPLLLTKRKSDTHRSVVSPEDNATPPPVRARHN